MTVTSLMLKRIANLPPETIPEMLLVLAEQQETEEKRKESQRERTRRHRDRNVTVTSPSRYTEPVIENAPAREPACVEDISSTQEISEKKHTTAQQRKMLRGTRIPEDFEGDIPWAVSQGLSEAKARQVTVEFKDYWRGVPGKAGVKLDWMATWRNRIRAIIERIGIAPATGPPNVVKFWTMEEIEAEVAAKYANGR